MEFLEAMRKVKKMCKIYVRCSDCPLCDTPYEHCQLKYILDCDVRVAEKIISEWTPPIDWSKVKVDTPIVVWERPDCKYKRHFAKFKDGLVYAWSMGGTSLSTEYTTPWIYAELAEEDENG